MTLMEVRYTYGSFSRLWCHCQSSCQCRCRQAWEGCTAHCHRWTLWCCCSSWTGTRPRRCCRHSRRSNHSGSCTGRIAHCRKWKLLIGMCERLGEGKALKGDVNWSNPPRDSTRLHTEVTKQEHILYQTEGLGSNGKPIQLQNDILAPNKALSPAYHRRFPARHCRRHSHCHYHISNPVRCIAHWGRWTGTGYTGCLCPQCSAYHHWPDTSCLHVGTDTQLHLVLGQRSKA